MLVLLAATLLACATTPAPGGRAYEGLVVHVGVEAVLSLEREGHARALLGSERDLLQLDRLAGASVAIRGALVGDDRLRVRSFELLDPGDGLTPMVGTLVADQFAIVIDDEITGTRLALRGSALRELKRHHGGRVWITGSIIGPRQVLIAHWGLLLTAHEAERLR